MPHRLNHVLLAARALALSALMLPAVPLGALAEDADASTLFGGAPGVETDVLADTRGAENVSITGDVGINMADQRGTITGNAITAPTTNGALSGNSVSGNRGLAISNFNTGNFNTFQTSVQYNIFLK